MAKYNTYTLENGLRIIHLPSNSQVVYCGYICPPTRRWSIVVMTLLQARAMSCLVRKDWLISANT